jgi:hypothetical protein
MNPIDLLKKEHEEIERELLELETMHQDEEVNMPNLFHTFKKLHRMWDEHEKKEEKLFEVLEHDQIIIPVKKMLMEHQKLRKHKNATYSAINSGSEAEIKKALSENVPFILNKLRNHIADEDEVLYTLTLELFTKQKLDELNKSF